MANGYFSKGLFLCLSLLLSSLTQASTYIRYNLAGYYPNQQKRVIVMSDENLSGKNWTLSKEQQNVLSGTIGANSTGVSTYTAQPYNYEIPFTSIKELGDYLFSLNGVSVTVSIKNNPHEGISSDILRGFRARRSGSNDAIVHPLSHQGDASCDLYRYNGTGNTSSDYTKDITNIKVDALGGWYDAGDYIKFTLTNAYATYNLVEAYHLNRAAYSSTKAVSTTSYNDFLDEAIFGLEYLSKMLPDSNTFIIQVGDEKDHNQGVRLPQNDALNGQRKAYSAFSKTQMAMTVAALSAGARMCKTEGLTSLANKYETKAIKIYDLAKRKGIDKTWIEFYGDKSHKDNMKLGAYELYKLTQNPTYLNEAKSYSIGVSYWVSWGDMQSIVNDALYNDDASSKNDAISGLQYFSTIANETGNIWNLPHQTTWGTLYSLIGVGTAALNYEIKSNQSTHRSKAIDVLDYTMGLNNWGISFVATQRVSNAITSPYAQFYRLQPTVFPLGEIAEGPAPKSQHSGNTQWFSPAHNPNLWTATFNTDKLSFFDHKGDYVCMETTIGGLSDGLRLFATADYLLAENQTVTSTFDNVNNEKETHVYPNPTTATLRVDLQNINAERISIFDVKGKNIVSQRVHKNIEEINTSQWEAGMYTLVIFLKNGKTKMETFQKL